MFFIIGLGLGDNEDVTVKGLNAIRASERVYLEAYTSILGIDREKLEKFYGKSLIIADRDMVEQNSDEMCDGDPFSATTHTDLVLRLIEKKIAYKVIHNASIINAVGCCGLQLYNYGEIVSFCFWTDTWKPTSYFEKINSNRLRGLHTLCLLDIKVKERSTENIIKNRPIFEPPRYMSVADACAQILEIIENEHDDIVNKSQNTINESTMCVGLARVGQESQKIIVDTLKNLATCDLGEPLHSLIVVGKLHPLESEFLRIFYKNNSKLDEFKQLIDEHNKFYLS